KAPPDELSTREPRREARALKYGLRTGPGSRLGGPPIEGGMDRRIPRQVHRSTSSAADSGGDRSRNSRAAVGLGATQCGGGDRGVYGELGVCDEAIRSRTGCFDRNSGRGGSNPPTVRVG